MDAASATPELLPAGAKFAPWHQAVRLGGLIFSWDGSTALPLPSPGQWAPSHGGNLVFLTLIQGAVFKRCEL